MKTRSSTSAAGTADSAPRFATAALASLFASFLLLGAPSLRNTCVSGHSSAVQKRDQMEADGYRSCCMRVKRSCSSSRSRSASLRAASISSSMSAPCSARAALHSCCDPAGCVCLEADKSDLSTSCRHNGAGIGGRGYVSGRPLITCHAVCGSTEAGMTERMASSLACCVRRSRISR